MYIYIHISISLLLLLLLLYSIGFRLQFVSPNLEAFLFSTCSMFCSFQVLSFLACLVYLSYFPSSSLLLSFHVCFIFLQFPIHSRSISLYFPLHLLFRCCSFPFIVSSKCTSRKAQVPRKRITEILIRARDIEGKQVNKNSLKQTQIIVNCALVCFFWFIDS